MTSPSPHARDATPSIVGQVVRLLGGVLIAAGGAAGAITALLFLDTFRLMSIDSVFGTWESRQAVESVVPAIAVMAVCTPLGATMRGLGPSGSGEARATAAGSTAIWLTGAAIAGWTLSGAWTPPDAVGIAVDPSFGDHAPWGWFEWVWYSLPWSLPAVASLAGVIALGSAWRQRARSRAA